MSFSSPITNFDRAEFTNDPPAPDQCAYCGRGIVNQYFRVDGNLACTSCAERAQSLIPPDSHKAYSRALVFGIGAAVLGCLAYALIVIMTGWTIGYAAIGVGYLVGKAMKAGSRGLGGKRYQITAALLTYAAVAVSFVPIALHQYSKQESGQKQTTARQAPESGSAAAAPPAASAAEHKGSFGGFFKAVFLLLGLGLVSPFLELFQSLGSGLIGVFIIFIGISAAWRLTAKAASEVDGPFDHAPSAIAAP